MIEARAPQPPRWIFVSMAIGAYAALMAVMPSARSAALLTAPLFLGFIAVWTLARSHRWIAAFIAAALLLPPLPIPLGDSGPHPSLIFAALGIFAGMLHLRDWRIAAVPVTRAFVCLLAVLTASVAFAALYSGSSIAAQSLARVLLFGIGVYVFLYTAYM